MSNNKQSSIDWLEQELKKIPFVNVIEVFEQAKAMHREEIVTAHFNAQPFNSTMLHNAEKYYKETYESNT